MAKQGSRASGAARSGCGRAGGRLVSTWLLFLAFLCMALAAPAVHALDPERLLREYRHTAFGPGVGGPSDVHCFAQAPDGTLWLGTGSGLYRFDGVSFEAVSTLDGQDVSNRTVLLLHFDKQGGLWLGYGGLGSGYLSPAGRYRRLDPAAGWQAIEYMFEDLDGVSWIVSGGRMAKIVNGERVPVGSAWGIPDGMVYAAAMDSHGTIWAAMETRFGVFYLPRSEKVFRRVKLDFHPTIAIPGPGDTVWGSSSEHGLLALQLRNGAPDHVIRVSKKVITGIFFDRHGELWATADKGLIHAAHPDELLVDPNDKHFGSDSFGTAQGLSSDAGWDIFEDRDGDLWSGSTRGMDRFRPTAFRPLPLPPPGHGFGVIAGGSDGAVLAANWDSKLLYVRGREIQSLNGIGPYTFALHSTSAGGMWAGGEYGIRHSTDGIHFEPVPVPEDVGEKIVKTITEDPQGRLWAGTFKTMPVGYVQNSVWQSPISIEGLPGDASPVRMFTDSRGEVWIGLQTAIYLVDGTHARKLVEDTNAIGLGRLISFAERDGIIWLGGTDNVLRFDGKTFRVMTDSDGGHFKYVGGLVARKGGDLWMRRSSDVVRIPAAEIERWVRDQTYRPNSEHFDETDGVVGNVPNSTVLPTMAESSDGVLWFSSDEGLSSLDPDAPRQALPLVHPVVRGLQIDGKTLDPAGALRMPASPGQLEISYSAPNVSTPERLRYRYRLDGLDSGWQDAGRRRSAFYTNLGPGHYRFRVAATLQSGIWNGAERVLEFDVAPAWFQTLSFRVACCAAAIALLWALHRLRIVRMVFRLKTQQQVELRERGRIARELHDTLLQDVQVLNLVVGTAVRGLPEASPERERLLRALTASERAVRAGRDRVCDLRNVGGSTSLEQTLRDLEINACAAGLRFELRTDGTSRRLKPEVAEEVHRVLDEALRNVVRHAEATSIEVAVRWTRTNIEISLRDDGKGVAEEIALHGRSGHWGLRGMRERMERIDGKLALASRPGEGFEILISLRPQVACG